MDLNPDSDEPVSDSDNAVAAESTEESTSKRRARSAGRWVLEWVVIIAIAIGAALILKTYCFQTFFIPSQSMEPTLHVGDRIVVSKLSVRFGTIHRGDILVFTTPAQENCGSEPVKDLVKRVIGLPGEGLKSVNNTIFYTNNPGAQHPTWHKVDQWWEHNEPLYTPIPDPTLVPNDSYFMMGDNQPFSCDSRMWGSIPRSTVVGKVVFRIWPPSRIGIP
jgi:signal peptidase I